MKKAVLIVAFIFILLSISLVSAVLTYNSAQSNVCNREYGDGFDDDVIDNLFKGLKKLESKEVSSGVIQFRETSEGVFQIREVSDSAIQLKGNWDKVKSLPCDLREELGLEVCEEAVPICDGTSRESC